MTNMKGQLDRRTKVVLRHLPPSISQAMLVNQIDVVFADRYNLVSFRPGKNNQKHLCYSRAYLDFKMPEDVFEFAEFFSGHAFVNEKGVRYKTVVEYAPSQRVPKQWSRKDGREGTIFNDSEYLEFLEFLEKPTENLPSAEIQLERREAERAGAVKETLIVTPLMDFIRQKRAEKSGSRRSTCNGKPGRKAAVSISSAMMMRRSERRSERRNSKKMYVLKDATKNSAVVDKSNNVLVPKTDDQLLSNKSITLSACAGTELLLEGRGSGVNDAGKMKVLLMKGKQWEISQQKVIKNIAASIPLKQNQRCEGNGRKMRSIFQSKDGHQIWSSGNYSDQHIQTQKMEKERWYPRPQHVQLVSRDRNGASDSKVLANDVRSFGGEKEWRRSKDRLDLGVWAPHNRLDGSFPYDESLSSSIAQYTASLPESSEGPPKDLIRHGSAHNFTDADSLSASTEARHSRRAGVSGYCSHEKQVWVQKSSSGS